METFTKLFGSLLVFVYHCFDRMVIQGYLSGLSRPEQVIYFFRDRDPSFAALASFALSLRTLCDGVILLHAGLLLHLECVPLESLCLFRREAGLLIPSQFRGGVPGHVFVATGHWPRKLYEIYLSHSPGLSASCP